MAAEEAALAGPLVADWYAALLKLTALIGFVFNGGCGCEPIERGESNSPWPLLFSARRHSTRPSHYAHLCDTLAGTFAQEKDCTSEPAGQSNILNCRASIVANGVANRAGINCSKVP